MRAMVRAWWWFVAAAGAGGWLLQAGCVQAVERELEVLLRPEANLGLVRDSVLVNLLGPQLFELARFFQ